MSYTVSQLDPEPGRASILDLWRRNLPAASEPRYTWLYEQGPATGWLLQCEQGNVVGSAGLMARTFQASGRLVQAGQAIDLNVDRDHRSVGPALGLGRAVVDMVHKHQLDLIYAFPDAKSEPVLKRVGYQELGRLGRWAKPLQSEKHLPGWLRHKGSRKAASVVVDSLLQLKSPETLYRRPAGVEVYVTDHFDARFDALWEKAAPELGIVGRRTSAYLSWRFGRCPDVCHRVFCLGGADGLLRAYLVYSRREGVVHVNDFLFADFADLDVLLAEFIRLMRRQKAETIVTVYLGSSAVYGTLNSFGFLKRPSDWKAMIYVEPQQRAPELAGVLDQERWFLTRADVDTDD